MQSLDIYGSLSGPPVTPVDRRRRRRYRIHLPAYARLGTDFNSTDLHEILDISEEGVCIQSACALECGALQLSLDRSGNAAPIFLSGEVVWSSQTGRTGIRFPEVSPSALLELQALLNLNALAEKSNFGNEPQKQRPESDRRAFAATDSVQERPALDSLSDSDFTSILGALSAARREAEGLGSDVDRILQLTVTRIISFTGGTGAAIAISGNGDFICRASVGNDAPPHGTRVESESGFSGQCIRSGKILYCEDAENDPRVNREHCRALGVRSILAVPIHSGHSVTGLMEVFSPSAGAFGGNASLILQYLSETVASALDRASGLQLRQQELSLDQEQEVDSPAGPVGYSSWLRSGILTASILTLGAVCAWLLVPHEHWKWVRPEKVALSTPSPIPAVNRAATLAVAGDTLPQQRKRAEQGDPAEQFAMGVHYAMGDGVPQDYTEAARWFSLAADQGHVEAQGTLGAYYWAGRGVPQDLTKAYFWSVLAQLGGDKASKYRVPILASRLSHDQVLAAQQQANDWLKDHEAHGNDSSASN